ncbi:pfs domain-containing protein [Trichoderma gamsii]|uniref:Pfs domain-containing protein n=1 Tax=Trichoderma gamsii TaxID=398673 RepID=A0A2P4ZL58_9HYPO|nr:pfs domain-containing protein [Trichoderma gamsii]PON25028.1 pfs domain-containing protein [Trichoderma gamsii]
MPSRAPGAYMYTRLPAVMAHSLTQITGTVFGGLIFRFREAVDFYQLRMRRFVLLHCLLDIEAEEIIFKNAVLRVLEIDHKFDKIDWLLAERLLKSKLGAQYMIYNDCIEKVLASVNALAFLTDPDKSEISEGSRIAYQPYIKPLIWDEAKYDRFLLAVLDIDASVEKQLQALHEANQKLMSVNVQKISLAKGEFARFEKLRSDSSAAVSSLASESLFDCSCHPKHATFLKIPDWYNNQDQKGEERISVLFQNRIESSAWKNMEMSFDVTIAEAEQKEQPRRRVRFAGVKQEVDEDTADSIIINLPTTDLSHSRNLCSFFASYQESKSKNSGLNVILTTTSGSRVKMTSMITSNETPVLLPLEELFKGCERRSLTTLEKLKLSIQAASAILCCSTSWLTGYWSTANKNSWYDIDAIKINLWASRDANAGLAADTPEYSIGAFTDPAILALSKFLVELWFGAPWAHVKKAYGLRHQRGLTTEAEDRKMLEVILNWASDMSINPHDRPFYEEGRLYMHAVRNCLECDFGQMKSSMSDKTFREGVYSKILRPLRWALDEYLAAQIRLFGEVRDVQPEKEHANKRLTNNSALFDDARNIDGTKNAITDEWFEDYYAEVKEVSRRMRSSRPSLPDQRIRVAVLDTGIDTTDSLLHPFMLRRQIIYQDFTCTQPSSSLKVHEDKVGHGTHICGTLLRIAENIDLYVARVSVDGKDWNESQVAKAINWAVEEKKVHIISISFGFPRTTGRLEPIRRAILKANAADVLIFAAASNGGKNKSIAFPACMDEVLCVGSTDGNGNKSSFTPKPKYGKFSVRLESVSNLPGPQSCLVMISRGNQAHLLQHR